MQPRVDVAADHSYLQRYYEAPPPQPAPAAADVAAAADGADVAAPLPSWHQLQATAWALPGWAHYRSRGLEMNVMGAGGRLVWVDGWVGGLTGEKPSLLAALGWDFQPGLKGCLCCGWGALPTGWAGLSQHFFPRPFPTPVLCLQVWTSSAHCPPQTTACRQWNACATRRVCGCGVCGGYGKESSGEEQQAAQLVRQQLYRSRTL